jgi:hypothetical protein
MPAKLLCPIIILAGLLVVGPVMAQQAADKTQDKQTPKSGKSVISKKSEDGGKAEPKISEPGTDEEKRKKCLGKYQQLSDLKGSNILKGLCGGNPISGDRILTSHPTFKAPISDLFKKGPFILPKTPAKKEHQT